MRRKEGVDQNYIKRLLSNNMGFVKDKVVNWDNSNFIIMIVFFSYLGGRVRSWLGWFKVEMRWFGCI